MKEQELSYLYGAMAQVTAGAITGMGIASWSCWHHVDYTFAVIVLVLVCAWGTFVGLWQYWLNKRGEKINREMDEKLAELRREAEGS